MKERPERIGTSATVSDSRLWGLSDRCQWRTVVRAVALVLVVTTRAGAGTFQPEDPNVPAFGPCDESLANTVVEKARCSTKDDVFGALSWLTLGARHEIDESAAGCKSADLSQCPDLQREVNRLRDASKSLDSAFARHPATDKAWANQFRASLGSDPTEYQTLLEKYALQAPSAEQSPTAERARAGRMSAARELKTLHRANHRARDCLDDIRSEIEGTELLLSWSSRCQTDFAVRLDVTIELQDDRGRTIAFLNPISHFDVAFQFASRQADGPTATGTAVLSLGSGRRQAPREKLKVGFQLSSLISKKDVERVSIVRLSFETSH